MRIVCICSSEIAFYVNLIKSKCPICRYLRSFIGVKFWWTDLIREFFLTLLNSGMVGWSGWECAARHMPVTDQPPSAPDLPLHDNNNRNNNNNRPVKTAPDTHIKVKDKSRIKERQNLHNSNRILKSDKTDIKNICCLMHI